MDWSAVVPGSMLLGTSSHNQINIFEARDPDYLAFLRLDTRQFRNPRAPQWLRRLLQGPRLSKVYEIHGLNVLWRERNIVNSGQPRQSGHMVEIRDILLFEACTSASPWPLAGAPTMANGIAQ